MNCSICKVNKIGPKHSPFGGFLCDKEHLQCQLCNRERQGLCGICGSSTKFVQMNFNLSGFSLEVEHTGTLPTAPPFSQQSGFLLRDPPICCSVSKNCIKENDIQWPIIENSKQSLKQVNGSHVKGEANKTETTEIFKKKHNPSGGSSQNSAIRCRQINSTATPPLIYLSSTLSREPQIDSNFSKKLMDDVETQSQLNEEQLSMKDSKVSLNQSGESHAGDETIKCVETLFVGSAPVENSLSIIKNSFNNCTNISDYSNFSSQNSTGQSSKVSGVTNENIFTFEEDPNDANIIKSCEIRFLDSSDSLRNFYSTSKTNIFNAAVNSNTAEQSQQPIQKQLSKKNLSDFEADNRAKVEKYLNSCDSIKTNTSKVNSPRNCSHAYCSFHNSRNKSALKFKQKTVSVSTESDPSLKCVSCEKPDVSLVGKFKPQEYLVMPAVSVAPSAPLTSEKVSLDKFGKPSIDVRMQKVLETLQEQPTATLATEKSNLINKILPKAEKQIQEPFKEDPQMALIAQLINVYRAFYNPPNPLIKPINNLHYLAQPEPVQQQPPAAQFQTVSVSAASGHEIITKKSQFTSTKPVPAYLLNIPRTPIKCPETNCQRMIFVSDFNKHFVVDHNQLPMERIIPFQCKNFFLDARLAHCGISKCHLLYLMRNKITDLGSSEYKDFLPILVMTARISLSQMCGVSEEASNLQYFLIWITGIAPEEFPISVSLTLWPRSGTVPSCHLVYSGHMYSIRNSQCALNVWQSGRMLMLSAQEIEALTNNGKEMLNLQLMVH